MPAPTPASCPKCKELKPCVVDSRPTDRGRLRRYECGRCENRFSTIEVNRDNYVAVLEALDKLRKVLRTESVKSLVKLIMQDE